MKIIQSIIENIKYEFYYLIFVYNLFTNPIHTVYGKNFKPIYIPKSKHPMKNSNELEDAKSYFLNEKYLSKNDYETYNLNYDKYKAKVIVGSPPYNEDNMCTNTILFFSIFLDSKDLYYSDLKDIFDFVLFRIKIMINDSKKKEIENINDINLLCNIINNKKYKYLIELNNNHKLFTNDNKLLQKSFNIRIVCDKN